MHLTRKGNKMTIKECIIWDLKGSGPLFVGELLRTAGEQCDIPINSESWERVDRIVKSLVQKGIIRPYDGISDPVMGKAYDFNWWG